MDILSILEMIKVKIESMNPVPQEYLVSKGSYNGFEDLVPKIAEQVSREIDDDLKVSLHLGHHFPDLDLILNGIRYGVELKSRNNGSWDTNGNSVFESISDKEYEEIFLLFGTYKKGIPRIKVRYAPYWKVTSSITVTHSPRFKINMDTQESVFSSSGEYDKLRNCTEKEKVIFLQNYLKNNTTGVKWFVPRDDKVIKPTSLNSLDSKIKEKVSAEIFILYPQDLLNTTTKGAIRSDYSRSAEYLIMNHYYYSSSFRDFFSAGGQWEYNSVKFPQVIKRIHENRQAILETLENANLAFKELAYNSWEELNLSLEKARFVDDYKIVLDYLGKLNFPVEMKKSNLINLSNLL
ncbi:hypothetical protein [Bacillus cereus group sp. BfR-BA-01315]|uniref:hypothetical protein n=1 Tax=Bacillus cereus group sp. BfR-BA-01315 TaxID=2920292 RepID=UPI001F59A262|nr:hypothetical protein [Bacillus cereus group sp. BfR-BA-01315]